MSLIRAPEIYDRFERVSLTHTCRRAAEFACRTLITQDLPAHPYIGELVRNRLIYHPTCTREPFARQGRITDPIASGRLFADLALPTPDPGRDRAMVCGNEAMLADTIALLEAREFEEGSNARPGTYVVEKASPPAEAPAPRLSTLPPCRPRRIPDQRRQPFRRHQT